MAEIQLVDIDAVIPETTTVTQEDVEEEEGEVEVAPPLKRGRGRPPGAKNKIKSVPKENQDPEPPTPAPKKKPRKHVVVEYASSSSEEYEAPSLPKKKRRSVEPSLPPPIEPDSPRTHRHKMMQNSQNQRQARHSGRVQEYSSLLNEMLAY